MPNWRELPLNDSRCTSAARDDAGYTKGYCRLHRRALPSGALWPLFFSSRRTSVVAYTDLVVDHRIGFLPIVASGWWCTLNQRTIEYAGAPINTLFVRPAVGTPSPDRDEMLTVCAPHPPTPRAHKHGPNISGTPSHPQGLARGFYIGRPNPPAHHRQRI